MATKSRDPDYYAEKRNNISEINILILIIIGPHNTMDIRSHASFNRGGHMVTSSFETGLYV